MPNPAAIAAASAWPPLPLNEWQATCATLHMWTQIVGKVRLALSPHVNHWWGVPLYVTARGLTTSPIPYAGQNFAIEFDFLAHQLELRTSWGARRTLPLAPQTVADFYRRFMETLRALGIVVQIWPMPVEVPQPVRFDADRLHAAYDPAYVERFWHILVAVDAVLKAFRARFLGKASPVHFFWGSFDLAATRFSGRRAPPRENADRVTQEAYSHEVSSVGFWPGSGEVTGPAFYAYAAPEPPGFRAARVQPAAASYEPKLGEFLLMYDDVRAAADPAATLFAFLQSTYAAAATLGHWDRAALERPESGDSAPS